MAAFEAEPGAGAASVFTNGANDLLSDAMGRATVAQHALEGAVDDVRVCLFANDL